MTNQAVLAREIFLAALAAVDPFKAVQLELERVRAFFQGGDFTRLLVIGFGKASWLMAAACEHLLSDVMTDAIIVTKYGHASASGRLAKITTYEAGHPVPDENGVVATRAIIDLVRDADERTLILCLISGGGSALLVAPREGITLREKQEVTDLLLRSGATIHELNAVRKHLSMVKGGRLAQIAHPASIISLIISDVVEDSLDVIASGPTAPDTSTYSDARAVLARYGLTDRIPEAVLSMLEEDSRGKIAETPKHENKIFNNVQNIVVASNSTALLAAKEKAEELGFPASILSSTLQGEARDVARSLSHRVRAANLTRPACLLSGGETTVTVRGTGVGGRNTELALAFALEIDGVDGITLLSAGTDGTDGPTDAAGAVVDGHTVSRAGSMHLDAPAYLNNNDSYTFFRKTDELLVTGPTGTNVMDIQIVLAE
jgi:glycerate 2-kinase